MKFISHLIQKRFDWHEDGQALVLIVMLFFLVIAAAVFAIDLGTYVNERQRLEITVDAAALAGGLELPRNGVKATSKALEYINKNDPDVDPSNVTTAFRCIVGDRNRDGLPDPEDIPVVCDPGTGASWTCNTGTKLCISPCVIAGSNSCNTMDVTASKEVPLIFTRALGLPPLLITASRTGACKGLCGDPPGVPLDVIIVLDRTTSMSEDDLENAKNGAKSVLEIFNPEMQYVGLAILQAGVPGDPSTCTDKFTGEGGVWQVVPLSNDYQNPDGSINESSQLVSTINALQRCHYNNIQTNLGSPLSDSAFGQPDALTEILDSGRDVKKGIIIMTDGEANQPYTYSSCQYAYDRAKFVKDLGIEIFTIGYGIENARCTRDRSSYGSTYRDVRVTKLLADMATNSLDDHGSCRTPNAVDAENSDGDHFLCLPRDGDLSLVFRAAAAALSTEIKLVPHPDD